MVDVLVVGAGPTGLFMAIELKRRGLSVRLIEQTSAPSDKSKAIAIQPRTLEIFDQIGIIDPFLKEGLKICRGNLLSCGHTLAEIDFTHLDSSYPFILSLEQNRTEHILQQHLATLGVEVEREVELLTFEKKKGGVDALLSNGTVSAAWLIGCDGAHSTTRKTLGLSFAGRTFPKTFSLADVQIDWEFPHDELFLFLNETGILAAIPLPEPKRYRIVFQSKPTLEEVRTQLRAWASPHCVVSRPRWMTEFSINTRMAEKYSDPPIFLVGDAAHIHSPAGGQGMNTGLQDAYNLAWKLALVHQGKAHPSLLDTYDLERRHVGKKILRGTEWVSYIATLSNPLAISLRNWILSKLSPHRFFQRELPRTIGQLAIRYPRNLAIGPGGGTRAPNAKIGAHSLYALCRSKKGFFVLHNQPDEWAASFHTTHPEVILLTHDGAVYERDKIHVIRPDLHIGCCSADPSLIKSYFSQLSLAQ